MFGGAKSIFHEMVLLPSFSLVLYTIPLLISWDVPPPDPPYGPCLESSGNNALING